jgi:hypothetical protein
MLIMNISFWLLDDLLCHCYYLMMLIVLNLNENFHRENFVCDFSPKTYEKIIFMIFKLLNNKSVNLPLFKNS